MESSALQRLEHAVKVCKPHLDSMVYRAKSKQYNAA
jgi:hypothetical protein